MEKTVEVSGESFRLVTNAFTPILYKQQFGRDYFQDMMHMFEGESFMQMIALSNTSELQENSQLDVGLLKNFDMTFFHRLFWTFARSGNSQIPSFEQFFMSLDEFPVQDLATDLMEMLEANMVTKKRSMTAKPRAMRYSQ